MTKSVAYTALASVLLASTTQLAAAATVPTAGYLAAQTEASASVRTADTARIAAFLQRADVQRQLQANGVTADEAQARLAALSDADIARINGQIDTLPAGSSLFALVGAVFIVLLILEIVGVTDIFKKV